MQEAHQ